MQLVANIIYHEIELSCMTCSLGTRPSFESFIWPFRIIEDVMFSHLRVTKPKLVGIAVSAQDVSK